MIRRHFRVTVLRVLLLPLASGCASDHSSRNIEAAYVLLGADSTVSPTFAEARIVVSDNDGECPRLIQLQPASDPCSRA